MNFFHKKTTLNFNTIATKVKDFQKKQYQKFAHNQK
ncbi:hypothetical protein GGR21_001831 [Dysgonomonas hofstadii]|uniref:Uncharacterized protein n=1 Tax=Dysgonomonas hofstadii TaxID=637886 RepID=A0A840CKP1_9BACT|nr:hypothetical protein [Dysgonomonas hofstadii]